MTPSDPQQILGQIKARTEEQPDDTGSAVELSELLDVARDDSLRLTEALEAVMHIEPRKLGRDDPDQLLFRSDGWNEALAKVFDAIEAKLSEGES